MQPSSGRAETTSHHVARTQLQRLLLHRGVQGGGSLAAAPCWSIALCVGYRAAGVGANTRRDPVLGEQRETMYAYEDKLRHRQP